MIHCLPSTQLVEKKMMFRVSRGFSLVQSGQRDWGSDSPVKEELSTWGGEGDRLKGQHRRDSLMKTASPYLS